MSFIRRPAAPPATVRDSSNLENPYAAAFAFAGGPMAIMSTAGCFLRVNQAFCEWLGYSQAELLHLNNQGITAPQDWDASQSCLQQLLHGLQPILRREIRYRHRLGVTLWGLTTTAVVQDESGTPLHCVVQIHDITPYKQAEKELAARDRDLNKLLETLPEAVVRFNPAYRQQYANPATEAILGLKPAQLQGKRLEECGLPTQVAHMCEFHMGLAFQSGSPLCHEYEIESPFGTRLLQFRVVPETDGQGHVVSVLTIIRDVTSQRPHAQPIVSPRETQTSVDSLTQLPHRRVFDARFAEVHAHCIEKHLPYSLLLVDMDQFQTFNDTHGHSEGDRALKQVGTVLRSVQRPSDFIARYLGEEFAVILEGTDKPAALQVAEEIRLAIASFPWARSPLTASIGVATLHAQDAETLLVQADAALYGAKERGRNCVLHVDELFGK